MADYAVGGIKLDFNLGNTSDITNKLDAMAKGLNAVRNAVLGLSRLKLDNISKFTANINELAKADFKGIAENFAILGKEEVAKNINNIALSFGNLSKSANDMASVETQNFVNNLHELSKADFSSVVASFKALNELDPKNLTAFNSVIRNIKKIGEDNIPFEQIKDHFEKLALAVDPFLQKLEQVKPSLQAFSNAIDLGRVNAQLVDAELKLARIDEITSRTQSKKVLDDLKIQKAQVQLEKANLSLDKMKNKADKTSDSIKRLFNLGKLYFIFNYTKRIGQAIGRVIKNAIDFTETLNKFQVSFGSFSGEATTFVNKLTNAFNLSSESIMNYMATFNNMLKGLGSVSGYQAEQLSETLTQLAVDYASLMNTSIDTAMQQFQSVLAGQVKSIRTTSGVDVTDNTIYQMYQALGGTKTQRQLSQTEKRLLRILAIQKQLSQLNAFGELVDDEGNVVKTMGDFEKTINSASNSLKRISQTFKEWTVYLGNILLNYLEPIIQKVLAFGIVLKEITKTYAENKGYTTETFGLIGDGASEANGEVEELQKSMNGLLSFDKFESLGKSSKNETEDLQAIIDEIGKYQNPFDNVTNDANEMAKSWLKILGYEQKVLKTTDNLGNEVEDIVYEAKDGEDIVSIIFDAFETLKSVLSILKPIFETWLNFRLSLAKDGVPLTKEIFEVITSISKTITDIFDALKPILLPVLQVIRAVMQIIYSIIEDVLSLVNTIIKVGSFLLTPMIKGLSVVIGFVLTLLTQILYVVGAIVQTLSKLVTFRWGKIGDIWKKFGSNSSELWSNFGDIATFATGGLPTKGQMFVANESGAELVGNIGGRTAVANNDMIVQAIEQASYRGIVKGMAVSSNKQDINIDLRGFNADEVARAIYTPLLKEFKRNGVNIQGA